MNDVALAGVVVHFAGSRVDDELAGPIGSGRSRRAAGSAGDRFDGEMEHRGEKRLAFSLLACGASVLFAEQTARTWRSQVVSALFALALVRMLPSALLSLPSPRRDDQSSHQARGCD